MLVESEAKDPLEGTDPPPLISMTEFRFLSFRKKQPQHRTNTSDDKRLQSTLKRLGVNTIPGIEEVNLFFEDNNVLHYINPKVQASITANTYVVSGTSQLKTLSELLPEIITQMGPESLANLKRMAEQVQQMHHGSQMPRIIEDADDDDEDDGDVPDLVQNFEEASEAV
eukprot:g2698.t1